MRNKIRLIIALLIMVGMVAWAINRVRDRSYSDSSFAVNVGSGSIVVTNPGSEPIPVSMRSEGRTGMFRIESEDLGLAVNAKRQNSGRVSYFAVQFDLPPGQATIDVVRGSDVLFVSGSDQRLNAVVTPMSESSARAILILTGMVELAALYYISGRFEHRWIGALRRRLPEGIQLRKRPAT